MILFIDLGELSSETGATGAPKWRRSPRKVGPKATRDQSSGRRASTSRLSPQGAQLTTINTEHTQVLSDYLSDYIYIKKFY